MNIGMLWFDNDPDTDLPAKIDRAVGYYQKKYGKSPNQCFVNPSMMTNKKLMARNVLVSSSPTILPNHLWIGFNGRLKQVEKSK